MGMNGRQRTMATINRLPVDRFPKGELVVDPAFVAAYYGLSQAEDTSRRWAEYWLEQEIKLYHTLGLDVVCLQEEKLQQPQIARRLAAEGFFVFQILEGSFQTALYRGGFTEFVLQVTREPQKAGAALQDLSNTLINRIKNGLNQWVHGIIIADDIAYQRQTYVRPSFIENYLGPCWHRQVEAARAVQRPVFFHSDGDINAVLPTIVQTGFDGLQGIEPAAGMEIAVVKQKYGRQLCLMGNLDPDLLTPAGHADQLNRAVKELIAVAAPGGGFIFGTCSGLYAGLAPEKVRHMYQLASGGNDR